MQRVESERHDTLDDIVAHVIRQARPNRGGVAHIYRINEGKPASGNLIPEIAATDGKEIDAPIVRFFVD
ncbi:MAG: hypothetical protein WAV78_02365 [Xanthobacteraceae bacterium]